MAGFYTGPHFWDRSTYEVTVKTTKYPDRQVWINDMKRWAKERGMTIVWQGESTHVHNDDEWHEAHFCIYDERDRVAFALAWAS